MRLEPLEIDYTKAGYIPLGVLENSGQELMDQQIKSLLGPEWSWVTNTDGEVDFELKVRKEKYGGEWEFWALDGIARDAKGISMEGFVIAARRKYPKDILVGSILSTPKTVRY